MDYNITENIREIGTGARNHTVKETTETWTYYLKIKSNLDRVAALEVTDTVPQEAVIISVTPKPAESTATSLKWKLQLAPTAEDGHQLHLPGDHDGEPGQCILISIFPLFCVDSPDNFSKIIHIIAWICSQVPRLSVNPQAANRESHK